MNDELGKLTIGKASCCDTPAWNLGKTQSASRRRRLWELEAHAHCPVVGLCLPIGALRRVCEKAKRCVESLDDYQLHCDAMNECKHRTLIADALQKEFDRRYALSIQQSSKVKSTEALVEWWGLERDGRDLPGAVWATLTHAQCTHALEHRVLGEVHMLQHQVGVAQRVDRGRFDAVLQEVATLRGDIAAVQMRSLRQADDHARESERHEAVLLQARSEIVRRESENLALREELRLLEGSVSDLKERVALSHENEAQRERILDLQRALTLSRQEADRQRLRSEQVAAALSNAQMQAKTAAIDASNMNPKGLDANSSSLDDRAVLCVGGRPASVPLYRHIVEKTGGRFLHHDGGDEQSVARLDVTLAAADLVICQTGCISHDAYWRVKDHCKRTGKPCVFVENPGTASLKRALAELSPASIELASQ